MLEIFKNLSSGTKGLLAAFLLGLILAGILQIDFSPDDITPEPVDPALTEIQILVQEDDSKPVPDVEVQLIGQGAPVNLYTNSSGYARVQIPTRGDVDIILRKDGYVVRNETINLSVDPDRNRIFRLERVEAPLGQPCYGKTCWNKDPKDNWCDRDAQTITSTQTSFQEFGERYIDQRLEMRYSDLCNATWVKGNVPIGFRAYLRTDKGETFGNFVKTDEGFYTDMGPGEGKRQACVESPDGTMQCTNFVE